MDIKFVRETVDTVFGKDNDVEITVKVQSKSKRVGIELKENTTEAEALAFIAAVQNVLKKKEN